MKSFKNAIVHGAKKKENCPHRKGFRRVPAIDGGLGLCPNSK